MPPIKLALLSCGLGNVQRGFETSTARWHGAIHKSSAFQVRLFSGGTYPDATQISNIPRNIIISALKPLFFAPARRRWEFSYGVEQLTFGLGFLPELLSWQPDVVWTKEAPLAHQLDFFRLLFKLRFKIIFANGGAFRPQTYQQFDFIQHLQAQSWDEALNYGINPTKMCLLSNYVTPPQVTASSQEIKNHFGISEKDWVIVCIAAWNCWHKRIDYLIKEVANMQDPSVRLILCGQPEAETNHIKKLGEQLLPNRISWLTLPFEEVSKILKIANVFVLPSLQECLGGSLIEAALSEVPIISHPHSGGHFVLQDDYWLCDLSKEGNLTQRLLHFKHNPADQHTLENLRSSVQNRFDNSTMAAKFQEMIHQVLTR